MSLRNFLTRYKFIIGSFIAAILLSATIMVLISNNNIVINIGNYSSSLSFDGLPSAIKKTQFIGGNDHSFWYLGELYGKNVLIHTYFNGAVNVTGIDFIPDDATIPKYIVTPNRGK